jgi:cobalt/nickel transport system permease protein
LLGAATAFVFAAQMLSFPLGAGTSAHLLGGVLLAAVAGPWAAMIALFSVLLVQALLFQDGGIAALGANTLNLAVVGGGGGYLLYRWQLDLFGHGFRRRTTAAAVAAFLSAILTGVAVAAQLALSGMVPLRAALLAVGGAHIAVGLTEATITAGILATALRSRPDLITAPAAPSTRRRWVVGTVTAALLVGLCGAGFASDLPDALASATTRLGIGGGAGAWLAAAIGVLLVFGLAWAVFRLGGRSDTAA